MSFSITYDNQPNRFLKKQEKQTVKRIMKKIEETLPNNPVPSNAKPIVDQHSCFRIRVGSYRVLYRINHKEKRIVVFKIDKRPKAY